MRRSLKERHPIASTWVSSCHVGGSPVRYLNDLGGGGCVAPAAGGIRLRSDVDDEIRVKA